MRLTRRSPVPPTAGLQLSSVDRERMERQKPLIAAADIIQAAVDEDAQANQRSGYSSIALGERSVVLRWKGALPRTVETAVEQARKDVAVEVLGARHTDAQMQAKVATGPAGDQEAGRRRPVRRLDADRGRQGPRRGRRRRHHEGQGRPAGARPAVEVTSGDVPEPSGRLNDTPSSTAAASSSTREGAGGRERCTAGFAVRNSSGQEFLVTAGHCGHPGIDVYNGDWSQWSRERRARRTSTSTCCSCPTRECRHGLQQPVGHHRHDHAGQRLGPPVQRRVPVHLRLDDRRGVRRPGRHQHGLQLLHHQPMGHLRVLRRDVPSVPAGRASAQSRTATAAAPSTTTTGAPWASSAARTTTARAVIFQDFHSVNQIWGVVPK